MESSAISWKIRPSISYTINKHQLGTKLQQAKNLKIEERSTQVSLVNSGEPW
jgi:hypothetical protein